jgi:hypothetical protein
MTIATTIINMANMANRVTIPTKNMARNMCAGKMAKLLRFRMPTL